MPSVFSLIIDGALPGEFVWRDERCVAFLSINPLRPGHTLVVPRDEVDHWIDLDAELAAHVMVVAQRIGRAQQDVFAPARVGLVVAGFEVPHTHVHVIPTRSMEDLDFANADPDPGETLAEAGRRLRSALVAAGHAEAAA